MKYLFSAAAITLLTLSCCNAPETIIYLDETQPLEARVEDALSHRERHRR